MRRTVTNSVARHLASYAAGALATYSAVTPEMQHDVESAIAVLLMLAFTVVSKYWENR